MKHTTVVFAVVASLLAVEVAQASPMPPSPIVTVTGTITEANWTPEETKQAIPGMSGSAGRDRKIPARFQVRLRDADVQITRSTGDKHFDGQSGKVAEYRLIINSDNKDLLKPGMKVKVVNYHVSGDEGGMWSNHDRVEILAGPPEPKR